MTDAAGPHPARLPWPGRRETSGAFSTGPAYYLLLSLEPHPRPLRADGEVQSTGYGVQVFWEQGVWWKFAGVRSRASATQAKVLPAEVSHASIPFLLPEEEVIPRNSPTHQWSLRWGSASPPVPLILPFQPLIPSNNRQRQRVLSPHDQATCSRRCAPDAQVQLERSKQKPDIRHLGCGL